MDYCLKNLFFRSDYDPKILNFLKKDAFVNRWDLNIEKSKFEAHQPLKFKKQLNF